MPAKQRQAAEEVLLSQLNRAVELEVRTPALYSDRGAFLYDRARDLPNGENRTQLLTLAKNELSKGIELDEDDSTLRNDRGAACIELGDFGQAADDFSVASQLKPRNPREVLALAEAYIGLGHACAGLGQSNDAQREIARALWTLHESGVSHYVPLHNIACIYAVLSTKSDEESEKNVEMALDFLRRAFAAGDQNEVRTIKRDQHIFPKTMWARVNQLVNQEIFAVTQPPAP